jgi:hypothetical protein
MELVLELVFDMKHVEINYFLNFFLIQQTAGEEKSTLLGRCLRIQSGLLLLISL